MKERMAKLAAVVGLAMLAFSSAAHAQVNTEPTGVARVSFIRGDVSMQRGDSGDASAVELNTPLVAGDKVFTGPGSRAEIQLDWANMLRLDENAQADIATLDRNRIQVQLASGLAFFSVLRGSEADVEINTPNVAVVPRRDGRYRIEVLPSGDTLVTVREGQADIATPDGSTLLRENQLITVRGGGSDVQFQVAGAPGSDEFDRWNRDRDDVIARAESYRRTNRYYTGAADLDAYGRWDRVPDYGYVWTPRVALGWAPYRHGRWVWTAYWGWTWTSYEPWGWAPYHYGRWFVHRGNWVWWPGPVTPVYRPVYAPAYVSFFGFGSRSGWSVGVSFGSGFGSLGWLPAGPGDFVTPWWGRHRNNFNVVNITNITNVYNIRNVNVIAPLRGGNRHSNVHNMLVNNQVRYGLSTVPAENFGRGRGNVRTVTQGELRDAQFVAGNVPVVPSRESLRSSDRTVNTAASRAQNQETRFFSRRMPSNQRESFSEESARLQQAIDRDGRFGTAASPNRNADNRGPDSRAAENRSSADNRGTDSRPAGNSGAFGNRNGNAEVNSQRQTPQTSRPEMPQTAQTPQAETRREPAGSGWRRFGAQPGAADAPANSQPQREPVLHSPRQRSTTSETSPNRAPSQAIQPAPAQNENRLRETQPGFSRFSGRRIENPNAERFVAQNSGGNQQSGNQAQQQNSDNNRQNGWQRFSGGTRSSAGGASGAQSNSSSPRTDTRPQIQLNRPIIQPRESAQPRQSAPPRDTGNRALGGTPRGASRESAPGNNQRFAPAPRSAPQPAAPSTGVSRPAPQSNARPSGNSQGGFATRSAPSSSNSRGRSAERSQGNR